jgi:hypothetical protein
MATQRGETQPSDTQREREYMRGGKGRKDDIGDRASIQDPRQTSRQRRRSVVKRIS